VLESVPRLHRSSPKGGVMAKKKKDKKKKGKKK
jgi:hypothetical protein